MTVVKELSVPKVAKAALKAAGGDVVKATRIMAGQVRSDKNLFRVVADPLIDNACYDAIRAQVRAVRGIVWTAPGYDKGGKGERVKALARSNLMMFPLLHGKLLGQGSMVEVLETAEFYVKQGNDMQHKASWLKLIARAMGGNDIVSNVLTEKRLMELKDRARGKLK